MADEATTAHLKASVQEVKRAAQVTLPKMNQAINQVFERWGLPQSIKVDNGYPIVIPATKDRPTLIKLWWIGLGIEVIQNSLGRPQENGAVECLQGICYNWVNPKMIETPQQLQSDLDKMSDFQRNHYKIPKKGMRTRIECYPELETNPRKYDPENFNMDLVWDFLDNQIWTRKVNRNGEVLFFGNRIYLNKKHMHMDVSITLNPNNKCWIFRDVMGNFLRSSAKGVPSEMEIKTFAMMSMN